MSNAVQTSIDNLNRAAQLDAVDHLNKAGARLQAAIVARDDAEEVAARQDLERAYHRMQSRCAS